MQSPGQPTFSTKMVAEMGWARSTDILPIPFWQSVPPKRKEAITSSLVAQQKQNKN